MERFRFPNTLVFLAVALLALPCSDSFAQNDAQVVVESETSTSVGQSLVFEIKEEFRSSEAFKLSQGGEDALQFRISVMPFELIDEGNSIVIYSVLWTIPWQDTEDPNITPLLLDNAMGYVGTRRYEETARNLVAQTDELATQMKEF